MRCLRCRRCTFCQANECCAYIYTSGTTGSPKAVMISHDNIVFETRTVMRSLEIIGTSAEEERVISYLPLSHVAGMMVDIITPLSIACYQVSLSLSRARALALDQSIARSLDRSLSRLLCVSLSLSLFVCD